MATTNRSLYERYTRWKYCVQTLFNASCLQVLPLWFCSCCCCLKTETYVFKYSLNLSLQSPSANFFFWTLLLFLLNLLFLFSWGQFHTDVPILVKRKIYNIANNSQIYVSSLYMIKLPKPVKFYHKFKSTFPTCFFFFSFSLFVSTPSFFFVELTYVFLIFLLFFLSHNPKSSNRPTVTGFTGWKQTIPYLQFDAIGTGGECRFFQKKLCWSSTPLALSHSLSLTTTTDISLLSLFFSFFCWDY